MAVEIKYDGVNPFGTRTPFVDQEVLRQESNGLISSITRLTLNGTRPRPFGIVGGLGPELINNGDFIDYSGWSNFGDFVINFSGPDNKAEINIFETTPEITYNPLTQTIPFMEPGNYRMSFEYSGSLPDGGVLNLYVLGNGNQIYANTIENSSGVASFDFYHNVGDFGMEFFVSVFQASSGQTVIATLSKISLKKIIQDTYCNPGFSAYKSDMDSLRSYFHKQFKSIQIIEGGKELFYHPSSKVVSVTFPESAFTGFYNYQIVLDCINSYQNEGVLEPVDEWAVDEDANGTKTISHTVSARGVGTLAFERARDFVLSRFDGYHDVFIFLDDGAEQFVIIDNEETPVLLDIKNRRYPLISRRSFVNRLTGEFRMVENWVYHPENQGTNGVITYETSVSESNGVTTVEISGEIQVGRIDTSQNEIEKAKQTFDSIDFQAIAQQEYEQNGGTSDLSTVGGVSVAQNADLGTVSFTLSWNSQKESSPYIIDSSTVTISKTGGPTCFRYSGTVKVDAGCQRDRIGVAKAFFQAVNWDARVLQQWGIYGTGESLTANPRSKSYSENPATGEVSFSSLYCADPEIECGAIEAFKYSMSWTPSINKYVANPIKEGLGFYDIQNLNFKNRQVFSIQGSAKRIKCFSLEAAQGEIRSRINLLMVKYFPARNRILLSSQISEDKNGDFINFNFSWNADAEPTRREHPSVMPYALALLQNGVGIGQTHREALSDFFYSRDSGGWGAVLSRLFLPVWGSSAANALDLVDPSRSGTWLGSVNHENKQATGDGSTGSFDSGFIPFPLTAGNFGIAVSVATGSGNDVMAGSAFGASLVQLDTFGNLRSFFSSKGAGGADVSGPYRPGGVFLGYGTGTDNKLAYLQNGGSVEILGSELADGSSLVPTSIYFMGANVGAVALPSSRNFRSMAIMSGSMTDEQAESFMLALDKLVLTIRL